MQCQRCCVRFTAFFLSGMCADIESIPEGEIVLLHACAHNPTGVDPSAAQWAVLADIFVAKKLVPLFDSAYQGYATGDPTTDAVAIRTFAAKSSAEIPSMVFLTWA